MTATERTLSEGEQARIRVSVLPVTYVMTMSAARWDSLSDEDRARIVYDDVESKYRFQATYEVLSGQDSIRSSSPQ